MEKKGERNDESQSRMFNIHLTGIPERERKKKL